MLVGILEILPQRNDFWMPRLVSFMPQVIATWCEELGHKVHYQVITSPKDELNKNLDVVFISSYTMTAYHAYCISTFYAREGKVVVLGGPHARSYPEDSIEYFDYVIGLCDKEIISGILGSPQRNSPAMLLTADKHPIEFPPLEKRWKYIEQVCNSGIISKIIPKIVPLISSTGCPNHCEFCVDADVNYSSIDTSLVYEDIKFLAKQKGAIRGIWYDPNFGVNFKDIMNVMSSVEKPKKLLFGAELNMRNLTEDKLKQLKENNFYGVAPGIESWFSYDKKSSTQSYASASDKVEAMSEQFRNIGKYLSLIQVNVIFGIDGDSLGAFELTKKFIGMTPNVYTNFQTLTIFGKAAPIYDRFKESRLINLPYNLMDGYSSTNAKLDTNLSEFYDSYSDMCRYAGQWDKILGKVLFSPTIDVKGFHLMKRSMYRTAEYYKLFAMKLKQKEFADFYSGKVSTPPVEYYYKVRGELGDLYSLLPIKIKRYLRGGNQCL